MTYFCSFYLLTKNYHDIQKLCIIGVKLFDGTEGERFELDTNQSAFCRASTLSTKYTKVRNKGFNWPVCREFRHPNSTEFS